MVTRRMQQIEDMMKLSSKTISHVGAIEECGSMSRNMAARISKIIISKLAATDLKGRIDFLAGGC
jgi:hypothetical protein